MITEKQLVFLALRIDALMWKNDCYAGEDMTNEMIAEWLINNNIQTL